jgi:hypothetical protein
MYVSRIFGHVSRHEIHKALQFKEPLPCTPVKMYLLVSKSGMTSPTKHTFGLAGVAATVFHRHLGFKGAPRGTGHLRSGQAYVGDLLWAGQQSRSQG